MLDFHFELNHKCVRGEIILLKWEVMLTSVRFIGFSDLKTKNQEPNQT